MNDILLAVAGVTVPFALAMYVWSAWSLSAVFGKAGEEPWQAWVPILNIIVLLSLGGFSGWFVLMLLVPGLGAIGLWVVLIMAYRRINDAFGVGAGMTVLAALLLPVWASVLGWGSARWIGAPGAAGSAGPMRRGEGAPLDTSLSALGFGAPEAPDAHGFATAPPLPFGAPNPAGQPGPYAAPQAPPPPTWVPPRLPSAPAQAMPAPAASAPPAPAGGPTYPPAFGTPLAAEAPWAASPAVSHAPISTAPTAPVAAAPAPPAPAPAPAPPAAPVTNPFEAVSAIRYEEPPAPISSVPGPELPAEQEGANPWSPPVAPPPAALLRAAPAPAPAEAFNVPLDHFDTSAEVSAVVGAPSLGDPRSARSSVSAQHTLSEIPDEDIFDATVLGSRKRISWSLVPPLGTPIKVTADVVIIGRRPGFDADFADAQLVPVSDDSRTVSKTHARLERHGESWMIVDLDSTNGVILIDDEGQEIDATPGVPERLTERFLLGDAPLRMLREGS